MECGDLRDLEYFFARHNIELNAENDTIDYWRGLNPVSLAFITKIIIVSPTDNSSKPMTIFSIDTIAVVVSNRKRALWWYRDVLGLRVTYIGPSEPNPDPNIQGSPDLPGHWIEVGPSRPFTRIHICELPDGKVEPGPTGITLLTDDIRSEYDRLRQKGVRFLYPPKKMEWGEWLCEFADPDGNEFDLKQPIPLMK